MLWMMRRRGGEIRAILMKKHFPQYQFHVSRITSIPILAIYDYYLFCQQNPILLLLLSSSYTHKHTHTWNTHITNSTSVSSKFNSSSRMNFSYLWGIKRSWGNIKIEMFSFDCVTGTQRAFQFSSTLLRTFLFCCVWIQFLCYCLWIYQVLLRLEMSMIHGIFIFRLSV